MSDIKNVLILEDNKYAAEELKMIIGSINASLRTFVCSNSKEAKQLATAEIISVFIVDIILEDSCPNDMSGLEFVDFIRSKSMYKYSPVIFTTSYSARKLYAYENLHCYQYLEKPFLPEMAEKIIRQALEMSERYEEESYIALKHDDEIIEQKINDIIYVKCKGRKLSVVTEDHIYCIYYKTISKMKEKFLKHSFFQCNRSTLVNRKYIRDISIKKGEIVLKQEFGTLTFGRTYKQRYKNEYL